MPAWMSFRFTCEPKLLTDQGDDFLGEHCFGGILISWKSPWNNDMGHISTLLHRALEGATGVSLSASWLPGHGSILLLRDQQKLSSQNLPRQRNVQIQAHQPRSAGQTALGCIGQKPVDCSLHRETLNIQGLDHRPMRKRQPVVEKDKAVLHAVREIRLH